MNVEEGGFAVVHRRKPARCVDMLNTHRLTGTVDVDGLQYDWELRREPQWGESEGWKGMTVALLQKGTQRGAILEFPPPKRASAAARGCAKRRCLFCGWRSSQSG